MRIIHLLLGSLFSEETILSTAFPTKPAGAWTYIIVYICIEGILVLFLRSMCHAGTWTLRGSPVSKRVQALIRL